MTSITILSLILGSATSFVGLMLAIRSFIRGSQKKAVEEDQEKRTIAELQKKIDRLERIIDRDHPPDVR